jgi:SAM-dependent methyltransferase
MRRMSKPDAAARPRGSVERFDPDAQGGRLLESEHRARYAWAAQVVGGRSVLDAGCGTGYGTRMLARAGAKRVLGVDVAEEALATARESSSEELAYQVADVRDLGFEAGSFDVVVCFEVIEHIDRREEALDELRRVLGPRGVLLISSPNRGVYAPGNPHHVHEYSHAELEQALASRFASVALYRQHPWLASLVLSDAPLDARERRPLRFSRSGRVEPGAETYTLAAASDGPLPDLGDVGLASGAQEASRLLQAIEASAAHAARLESQLEAGHPNGDQAQSEEVARLNDLVAQMQRDVNALTEELEHVRLERDSARFWLQEESEPPPAGSYGVLRAKLVAMVLRRLDRRP